MSSYQFSDEDSTDSDSGIRFKTTNTRNPSASFSRSTTFDRHTKDARNSSSTSRYRSHRDRSRDRSHSRSRRERSRSRDNRDRRRSHRTPEKVDRRKNDDHKREKTSRREPEKRPSLKSREKGVDEIQKPIENSSKQNSVELELETFGSAISSKLKKETANLKVSKDTVNLRLNKETVNIKVKKNSAIKLTKVVDSFGPALPPAVKNFEQVGSKSNFTKTKSTNSTTASDESVCGPALPPHLLNKSEKADPKLSEPKKVEASKEDLLPKLNKSKIGVTDSKDIAPSKSLDVEIIVSDSEDEFLDPLSPPSEHNVEKDKNNAIDDTKLLETIESDSEDDVLGPSLPPNLLSKSVTKPKETTKVLGPFIPVHLREKLKNIEEAGPENVPLPFSSDEEEMIGPLPAGQKSSNPIFTKLEERALEIKLNLLKESNEAVTVREEWMLELPQVQAANLGLGPRQFRAKGVPDMSDRSSWTDTPQDKAKKKDSKEPKPVKVDLKKEAELKHIKERDAEQEKIVEKLKKKKKRDKSLLDLHQEEFNKKKKTDEEKQERRPFDRDIDLKANRFDEAQKKSILKKAQLLDTRFSTGESKFL